MLGEISQAQKDRPCTVLLTKGPRTVEARDCSPRGLEQSRPETQPGGRRGRGVFTWAELAFGR